MKCFYKLTILLSACLLIAEISFAQKEIKTTLIFSDTVKTPFNSQWQYLSTDIYLFNGSTFNGLINQLNNQEGRKGWFVPKPPKENLEFLLLTAEMKNIRLFGPNELVYPLYNFQVNRDQDNKYQTLVSDNLDYVRIIDNLPLYSAGNFIDATIRARAITNNTRDEVLNMVAGQLKNLANLTNPTNAVFTLVGEFGSFLESSTRKKEYRFSSTIRLFEQKNFDTRLHSIRVYALTAGNNDAPTVATERLSAFMDTTYNPSISRKLLQDLVPYNSSPLIVVVNYKSLYRMEQISGDEITAQSIDRRRLRIENEYSKGLVSNETYNLEKNFLDFLKSFYDLKRSIELYKLNFKVSGSNGTANSLMQIALSYRQLLRLNRDHDAMNIGNTTYATVFKPEYNTVQGYAGLYLEEDINLKSTRELVLAINEVEAGHIPQKYDDKEDMVTKLHFADIFNRDLWYSTSEGKIADAALQKIEESIYTDKFSSEVEKINALKANDKNASAPDKLQQMLRGTACALCREKTLVAIKNFHSTYEEYLKQKELLRKDSLSQVAMAQSYIFLQKYQDIKRNIDQQYTQPLPPSVEMLVNRLAIAKRDIGDIYDFSALAVVDKPAEIVRELNRKMESLLNEIPRNLEFICTRRTDLCEPVKEKPEVIGVDTVNTAIK